MAYEVHGPYKTIVNATKEVDIIGLKGYKAEDIHVITKEEMVPDLKKSVNADVIGVLQDSDSQQTEQLKTTLQAFDMSDDQVERYEDVLKNNEIIIVVNTDDLRMGNEPDIDTTVLEEEL